jgi:hypothetical protein
MWARVSRKACSFGANRTWLAVISRLSRVSIANMKQLHQPQHTAHARSFTLPVPKHQPRQFVLFTTCIPLRHPRPPHESDHDVHTSRQAESTRYLWHVAARQAHKARWRCLFGGGGRQQLSTEWSSDTSGSPIRPMNVERLLNGVLGPADIRPSGAHYGVDWTCSELRGQACSGRNADVTIERGFRCAVRSNGSKHCLRWLRSLDSYVTRTVIILRLRALLILENSAMENLRRMQKLSGAYWTQGSYPGPSLVTRLADNLLCFLRRNSRLLGC